MNIKELEITKEMYEEAKRVEELFKTTKKMDCRTEEFRELNNKWVRMENEFEEKYCDEFDTLEIVNEYERREYNTDRREEFSKNVYKITYVGDTIRELEITKEMYNDAKRVENAWELSEKNEYFIDLWCLNDNTFKRKYGDVFEPSEIINEYERSQVEKRLEKK